MYHYIRLFSGLDPAGPYFENTVPEVRLDISDAKFVDVIHGDSDPILQMGKLILSYSRVVLIIK